MTNRAVMEREGREKGERPRYRYNFYLENGLADYLDQLSRARWNGHKDFSKIIQQIIREHRDARR